MFRKARAQSIAEYAVVMAVVIGAAVAMQVYVKRGLQAKVKAGTDAFTSTKATFEAIGDGNSAEFTALPQYEPYYAESSYDRYQENVEQEHLGGGAIAKEKVSDLSATAADGFSRQAGPANKKDRDAYWESLTEATP